MNGTTMMHMFAVTFIATAAGINVTPGNMIVMALLSICAAAGTPAIPIAGTTSQFSPEWDGLQMHVSSDMPS